MKPTRLSELARWAEGDLLRGVPNATVEAISTDTRNLDGGELFIALKGENHDAHEHLQEALDKGAAALLVHDLPLETEKAGAAIIRVRDTLKGLQRLAANYRRSLGIPVVGITGSSGKTSTKDLVRAVLSSRWRVQATAGNLNNHFGLPLSLLQTGTEAGIGVFEMGMSNPGEIELLAEIAAPDGAIITNIGTAHLEFMGSREAIALEKGMLAEAIEPDGWVVLPAHDDSTPAIAERCRARVVTAGVACGEVQARDLQADFNGTRFRLSDGEAEIEAFLPVVGEHMVQNATLAAAAGLQLGLSLEEIAAGLGNAALTGGRVEIKSVGGLRFLDDSYNANPESVRAALRTLGQLPVQGKRIAVLGRMAELGDAAELEHVRAGQAASENGVDIVLGIGDEGALVAKGAGSAVETHVFSNHGQIADYLREEATGEDLILLKGSRSAGVERVLSHLNESS